jgi:hypothetical protein
MALGSPHTSLTSFNTQDPTARTRWSRAGHVASFGEGRVCSQPGCSTVLSRYNSNAMCSTHDPGRSRRDDDPRGRPPTT